MFWWHYFWMPWKPGVMLSIVGKLMAPLVELSNIDDVTSCLTHHICNKTVGNKNNCRWGLANATKTIFDFLTRQDIPSQFSITHGNLQLSCICGKLTCISSIVFSMIFRGNTFLLAIYDREMGNYEFLNFLLVLM